MLSLILLTYYTCHFSKDFCDLANKAILNSTIKVPKGLREQTKYPGKYTFGPSHFYLLTVVSSSQTKEIKGYAIGKKYAAIVKRKTFNISDGFTLIDIQTQELYKMEKIEASDEKVNIYRIKPIDMFYVFSDIEYNEKMPLFSYSKGFFWDEKRNRPQLFPMGLFSAGAGAYFSASFHAKARFRSIKKAEISLDVTLNGKIGAELQAKSGKFMLDKEISIFDDIDIPIPYFGISFRFLGLKFEFGLFLTFGASLKDLGKNLQVDIDYFKGYEITAKRYICIKRHGSSDSGWNIDLSSIPSGNIVEGSSTDLTSNYITTTIQFKAGIKFKIVLASVVETGISVGFLTPFQITFGFDPLACPYPYLYGRLEIPLKAYFSFTGIKIKIRLFGKKIKYTLLHPKYKEIYLFHLVKTRKYCLFDSRNNNDYIIGTEIDGGEDGDDDESFINETSNRLVSIRAFDLENKLKTKTLLSAQVSLTEFNSTTSTLLQTFSRRSNTFGDITTNPVDFDTTIIAVGQNRVTSKVTFDFWYYTGSNIAQLSDNYSFFLKDYKRKDDGYIPITTYNALKTEAASIKLNIAYCENLTLNEMYVPSLRMGIIESDIEFGDILCVITKDLEENSTDYVDNNAIFTTDGTLDKSLEEHGLYSYGDEFFQIHLNSLTLPSSPDSETSVHYEVLAEWGSNYQFKSLLINGFSSKFSKGENIIDDDYMPKARIKEDMRFFILITYNNNYNVVNLRQQITLSEAQKIASSTTKTVIKTESSSKISCECTVQRYVPFVRINCSKENSTHRIITYAFKLDSVKPSEYKPQVIRFKENQLYGVFLVRRIDPKIKWVIIHMPLIQPLCNFTIIADEYYQIPFDDEMLYIPFRRENTSIKEITIKNVVQGNFIDEETIYFSNKYYTIDFDKTPVALALVRTIHNQYSLTNINRTIQTLINIGNNDFQILALEYWKDMILFVAPSLIIIDENHPMAEKTIPDLPYWGSVIFHVFCERADEILMIDKTTGITTERNIDKDGLFFRLIVTPGHMIDFVPICNRNLSETMCYFRQEFTDPNKYAIFRYPNPDAITILNTNVSDPLEQEDRQGLIEEVIQTDKPFYYMTSYTENVQIVRTYESKLDLELRVIDIPGKYKKFCLTDKNGFTIPVSRKYYTDEYIYFMEEFGIQSDDLQYYDFKSGENDSCIYATYAPSTDYNSTDYNETDYNSTDDDEYADVDDRDSLRNLLSDDVVEKPTQKKLKPSTKICDMAKSIKVSYYQDISILVPPESFNYTLYSSKKLFEEDWVYDHIILDYEITEYFTRTKLRYKEGANNSIYVLYLPYKEIWFNTTLKDNEYISTKENVTIHLEAEKLNYVLSENYYTIIDLGDKNEINLNLLGKGDVEFKTTGQTSLKIKGTYNLDSYNRIYVDKDINEIEIETVNIAKNAGIYAINSLNEPVLIKVSNMELLAQSTANLTNMNITDSIHIKQTATAIFDTTVTVNKANMIIEMIAYQNDLIPMIQGSLLEPPKTISIQRVTEDGPKYNDEYMIFDGQFNCNEWFERMGFTNSLFNTVRCAELNNSNAKLLDNLNENRGFISFVSPPPIIKNKSYMTAGLVFIIIFTIIDFGLIVFISVILLKKKFGTKRTNNFSNDPSP